MRFVVVSWPANSRITNIAVSSTAESRSCLLGAHQQATRLAVVGAPAMAVDQRLGIGAKVAQRPMGGHQRGRVGAAAVAADRVGPAVDPLEVAGRDLQQLADDAQRQPVGDLLQVEDCAGRASASRSSMCQRQRSRSARMRCGMNARCAIRRSLACASPLLRLT